MILTCSFMSTDPERWRRVVVILLHRGEALRSLKMIHSPFILSLASVKFCKTKRNPNVKKKVGDFDRLWYFSCFSLEVREWSDACVDRCVFIPEQICLRTPTNMFHISWQIYAAYSHKYISLIYFKNGPQICLFDPTNMFFSSDKYVHQIYKFPSSVDRLLAL